MKFFFLFSRKDPKDTPLPENPPPRPPPYPALPPNIMSRQVEINGNSYDLPTQELEQIDSTFFLQPYNSICIIILLKSEHVHAYALPALTLYHRLTSLHRNYRPLRFIVICVNLSFLMLQQFLTCAALYLLKKLVIYNFLLSTRKGSAQAINKRN